MSCKKSTHWNRRTVLQTAGVSWLTSLATGLTCAQESSRDQRRPPKNVIVLWMQGGPSQRDTFDPAASAQEDFSGGVKAIKTSAPEIEIASSLPLVAEQMQHLSVIRSVISKEGDHARGVYNIKTGFRPDPTLVHPSIGAVVCHQLPGKSDIPRHVSILSTNRPGRGGYLGDVFDAFQIGDPLLPIPDVRARVSQERLENRNSDLLEVVESEFSRGRLSNLDASKTLHQLSIRRALKMMTSEQLKAFSVKDTPQSVLTRYGDNSFGRGCFVATRLVKAGVRCVEVTLGGWDTHINNTAAQQNRIRILDPAMAAMVADLKADGLLDDTVIIWAGEFGRTPKLNAVGGRDHWPHGFSVVVGGGGIRGGQVIGQTNPTPDISISYKTTDVVHPVSIADLHATVLKALSIDYSQELQTPIGRPMAISEGTPIEQLIG
ncbi:MAG: hypothetical protein CMJ76_03220 [Planctomycetaceae bacterium]|nr:hypothetical protein [Planctomycetaceae bacterium]